MGRILRPCYLALVLMVVSLSAKAQPPVADFTMSANAGCAPMSVTFTDASSGANTYSWTFGTGTPQTGSGPYTRTYSTPGNYIVTQTVTNTFGSDTKTDTVHVYGPPTVTQFAATTPTSGCVPLNVQFQSAATPGAPAGSPTTLSYFWDFGDGTSPSNATDQNPSHTYTQPGTYDVFLQITNYQGCVRDSQKHLFITVYGPPTPILAVSPQYACGTPATFTFANNSIGAAPLTATWNFGVGAPVTNTAATQNYTYSTAGTYTATLSIQDGHGCNSTAPSSVSVTVYPNNPTFTGPSVACENEQVTFTNTTTGSSSAGWDYGDGVSDNTGSHTYLLAGTYNVTMTVTVGPCSYTLTKPITVRPLPVTTVTFTPALPCPAPTVVTFTATTPNATNVHYSWDFGDGQSTASNSNSVQSHTYLNNGWKYVTVSTTNLTTGCVSAPAPPIEVVIYPLLPKIEPDKEAGCIPFSPKFTLNLYTMPKPPGIVPPYPPYPAVANSWNWEFYNTATLTPPPAGTSNASQPTFTWNNVGDYFVKVIFTTPNGVSGCKDSATIVVHADTKVQPDFSATPLVVCPKDTVYFTNLTTHVAGTKYNWNVGDSSFSDPTFVPGFKHIYHKPATYSVSLSTDHYGCIVKKDTANYIVVHPSDADFSFSQDCSPSYKVNFTDMSTGATSWTWDFGDGTPNSNAQNPTHTYATTGTYNVTLHTSNNVYGCQDQMTRQVIIFDPGLSFTVDKSRACVDENVLFTGTFLGAAAANFSWVFDNDPPTFPSTDNTNTHAFPTRGYHTVKLIATYGNGCSTSVTTSNVVLAARPDLHFGATPLVGCMPLLVNFTDTSKAVVTTNIIARKWDFGDNTYKTGNDSTTSRLYQTAGSFNVKLWALDDLGCADSIGRLNYVVVRNPKADFAASKTTSCIHDTVIFSNLSTAVTPLHYTWDFGDGTFSSVANPHHAYNTAGVYTVKLTIQDSTPCFDTKTRTSYITVLGPHASFTKDKTVGICKSLQLHFVNTSTGATYYAWDMGNGTSPLPSTPSVYTYSAPGMYVISLNATDLNGCSDVFRDTVYLLGYNGAFTYTPTNACLGDKISFHAVVNNIPQITWNFGDFHGGTTINSSDTSYTYASPGTYYPVVIYSDGGSCTAFDSGLVPIRIDKVKADFTTSVPCVGVPFSLTSTASAQYSTPNSWLWVFPPANDSVKASSATYNFSTSGNHPVKLFVSSDWGCKDSVLKDVFINPLPAIDAGPADTGICPGDTIRLRGHGGVSYVWSPASLVSCTNCDSPRVWTAAPTTYYLTGTDANGCVNKDSITARIQIKTTDSVWPGGEVCIGETFRLQASGATIYKWQPEAFLDSPFIASPLARPIITTTYVLEAQEGTCLVRYDTVTVVVHPKPFFDAGYDQVINYGSAVMLNPTRNGIARIEWTADSTLSCLDCFDPLAHPSYTHIYYAKGYSDYGCVDSDSVVVRVRCNGDSVFIPNTFTPNGDGQNDYFYPRGKGITHINTMRIYNRWGELVFERLSFPLNDERSGWDGSFKGRALPPDVYMYSITTRCPSGEPVEWKGDITLVR